jgi:Protein of unknown function (DUF2934).
MYMLFLHQPIQSFLNLGVCKEYATMAKPRAPKKSKAELTLPPVETAATSSITNPTETAPAEARKSIRKPAIVRTDTRANLFPINLDDEIRRLAYLLSERRGFEPGHENEDWLTAEHEVRQRYRQQSA